MARMVEMACLLALVLVACARERSRVREQIVPTREQQIAEGHRAFLRACAACHGTDARGDGPVAPTLRVPPPDLTTLAARHGGRFPRAWVIDVVAGEREIPAHGTRDMPVWSQRFGGGSGAAAVASIHARRR